MVNILANNDKTTGVDLGCKQVTENDVLTKDGQRTTYTTVYKGSINVKGTGKDEDGNSVESNVTVELKLKCDDKAGLESYSPMVVGAKRKMELSLTNEDLDNHN